MQEIGKRILNLRKENNMTQMELADMMGITYQAVSSWERGNSMPDIEKIPQLADLFHVSIDELIGESRVIKTVLNNSDGEVVKNFSEEELKEVLPIIKPNQISHIISESDMANIKDIKMFLPYMSEEDVKGTAVKAQADGKDIAAYLPFMAEEDVKEIAEKAQADGKDIAAYLPFMAEEDIKEISMKAYADGKDVLIYLPFMQEDDVKEITLRACSDRKDIDLFLQYLQYIDDEKDIKDIMSAYMQK
jgi:transcriptional regulator with XRE-family HTH domain